MFFFYKNSNQQRAGEGVTRRVLAHAGGMMCVEVRFAQGAIGPMHTHPHEQLTYVRSGVFLFTIGSEQHEVRAGDTLYKKPNILHGCVCLESGVLVDMFTPQREDFL
ncbi:cupin domain-containing protein [Erwinia psidii]|uniref:Cupin domain-containing protein n=1 Tax=Erwinia psidii TaxID=69224 RepID=A0A3N6UV95_9GAMM|nr:cupin domain-containing protein [Erwinia psidii]MCX8962805.1 cupin domain-containing protein [Erwinia psidii]MCX8966123.1 cupin domain-containing protein [Erwinia psidii]RQM36775.1 cupin domain-containing protein [Erwinia psidii]